MIKKILSHTALFLFLLISVLPLASCIGVDEIMIASETLQPAISEMVEEVEEASAGTSESLSLETMEGQACIPQGEPQTAEVERVVDGDTIQVRLDGELYKVRYIGVNTPETVHPDKDVEYFGEEASLQNHELMEGKTILLYKDVSDTDQYGRLLRYVVTEEGMFVNYALVRFGYAQVVSYPPDTACLDTFSEAERQAREEGRGMWASSEVALQSDGGEVVVEITEIFYDGIKGESEPDEYVAISNNGTEAVNLAGWTLSDNGQNTFTFPDYEIQPGETCRVYTNEEHTDWCGFSFERADSGVWNNSGDTATLRDAQGGVVDWEEY